MDLSKAICERLAALEPQSMDLLDESGKHVGHAGAKAGGNHFRLTKSRGTG
jgi:BolA protein